MSYNPYEMRWDSELRVRCQELAKNQLLTDSGVDGNGDIVMADRTMTSLEVSVFSSEEFTISGGPVDMEILVIGSEKEDMSSPETYPLRVVCQLDNGTYPAGMRLATIPLSNDVQRYIKVNMKGNGAKVDAFLHYIPR